MAATLPKHESILRASKTLLQNDWPKRFAAASLTRGRELFLTLSVENVKVEPTNTGVVVRAQVKSQRRKRQRYLHELIIDEAYRGGIQKSSCQCAMGSFCKHGVALAMEIVAEAKLLANASPPPPTDPAESVPNELASSAAARAFAEMQDANNAEQWLKWLNRPEPNPPIPFDLRFRLRPDHHALEVEVFARRSTAKGKAGLEQTLTKLPEGTDPWREIAQADRTALEAVLLNPIAYSYSNFRRLAGEVGERALMAVLDRQASLADAPQAPRLGAPRQARWAWSMRHDGELRLTAETEPRAKVVVIDQVWYVDSESAEVGRVANLDAREFERLSGAPALRPTAYPRIASSLERLSQVPVPARIDEVHCRVVEAARVEILRTSRSGTDGFGGRLCFRYGQEWIDAATTGASLRRLTGNVCSIVHRDHATEGQWRQRLREQGLEYLGYSQEGAIWFPQRAPNGIDFWLALRPRLLKLGFEVVGRGFDFELLDAPDDWYADLDPVDSNWFDVELGVRLGEEKISLLPILLKALDAKSFSLTPLPGEASDATWMAPIDARRRMPLPLAKIRDLIAPLFEWLGTVGAGGKLRMPVLRADVQNDWTASDVRVRAAPVLARLANALKADRSALSVASPPGLRANLRDYQLGGLRWLTFLAEFDLGGILADDMGLGKTLQVLAHVLAEKDRAGAPTLVIMPTSLIPNWQAETARFAPSLRALTLHGGERRNEFERIAQADIVFTTYALLQRDEEELSKTEFALVVFDEAQAIKNSAAKGAQSARRLKTRRRLAVTGTPLENHLGELWSQFDLVLPGLLGDAKRFTTHFRTPIERHADHERRDQLARRVRPFLMRRRKQDVAQELPAKTEIVRRIDIDAAQRELYETVRLSMHERVTEAIKKNGLARSNIVFLDALLKLRQVCCDPRLVKLTTARKVKESAKRDALFELLNPLLDEGRRVLLFSQFTEMLDLIEIDFLKRKIGYVRLDGSTRDRKTPVAQFQAGSVPLMLISLKAGGVGLNLTAADTVIHYDPWWNPAVENQATDRAHRIGQDKAVFVYKLVCSNTVEDKILALQERKAELASAIIDGGTSAPLTFDQATVDELLGA